MWIMQLIFWEPTGWYWWMPIPNTHVSTSLLQRQPKPPQTCWSRTSLILGTPTQSSQTMLQLSLRRSFKRMVSGKGHYSPHRCTLPPSYKWSSGVSCTDFQTSSCEVHTPTKDCTSRVSHAVPSDSIGSGIFPKRVPQQSPNKEQNGHPSSFTSTYLSGTASQRSYKITGGGNQ